MNEQAKILIIEDDMDTAEAMKVTLESQGYSTSIVPDPETGFSRAKEWKPNLIVLDVMFGRGEKARGFEWAVRLKQDTALAPVPILMVTAINIRHPGFKFSPEADQEYLPVDEFIDKPAQPGELIEKTRALLAAGTSKWKDWPRKSE